MSNTETIWADVLDIIRNDTSQISYNTWFLPAHIRMIDDNLRIVYIEAKEDFTVNILKKRYIQMLQNTLKEVMNEEYLVVVKTSDQYDKEKPQPQNQRTRVTKVIKELYIIDGSIQHFFGFGLCLIQRSGFALGIFLLTLGCCAVIGWV